MNFKTQNAMKKNRFMILLAGIAAVLTLAACSDDDGMDPSSAEPTIAYPYDMLVADLNMADNLPVVAVVKSEAGLKRVSLSIRTADNETVSVKEVTEFFNRRSYSLSEKVNYKSGYTAAVVEAVDLLDRKVETELPIRIVDVVEAPSIVFTPERIDYDETVGGEMPRTHFVVSSSATLRSVEMFRVKDSGQEDFSKVDFTDEDPQNSFTFDELIQYGEFDKGFKVKATDSYGQVRIVTLPVKYKTVPPPAVEFADATIFADKDEQKAVNISIESQAGVVKVELYRLEGKNEELVKTTTYEKLNTLSYAETITFTNATSGVKVVVTDNVNRKTSATTSACVNMYYAESIAVGSGVLADGAQGANRLLSLGDQKTYSVAECLAQPALQAHADVKVYYMNGNAASVRIYSMKNDDSKNGEYSANGTNINSFNPINVTRFKLLSGVDFNAATAEDIAAIDATSIQSSNIKGKDELIGAVIAFKTDTGSSAGAGKVGLLKLVSISEKVGSNANARVFTFSIKLPKEQ